MASSRSRQIAPPPAARSFPLSLAHAFRSPPNSLELSAIHHHWLNRGFFYKAAFFLASRLPRQPLYWLAAGIGEVSRLFMRPAREGLETNLARIAGGDRAAIIRLSRATFRNYGTYLVDLARFQALSAADVERIFSALEGVEHFDEAVRRGRGIVVVTGHVGNWEL
ncbi:MAG: hypothetical protein HYR98_05550, partial [Nitrospirae bacterium]|nr:hypothetical protein [Nitrospirota bacterium]